MTENKLLNEFLDINKKPLDKRGYFYDLDLAYRSVNITEDFAIGFGEYLDSLTSEDMGDLSIKELLEIYKKEKGL